MDLKGKIFTGVATMSLAFAAQAGELVEQRGYSNCVDKIEHRLHNQAPKISPVYLNWNFRSTIGMSLRL